MVPRLVAATYGSMGLAELWGTKSWCGSTPTVVASSARHWDVIYGLADITRQVCNAHPAGLASTMVTAMDSSRAARNVLIGPKDYQIIDFCYDSSG